MWILGNDGHVLPSPRRPRVDETRRLTTCAPHAQKGLRTRVPAGVRIGRHTLMPVRVGEQAPEFTLPGTQGRDYTLSEYRGQPVVLVFYPGDNTPVCTQQLNQYTSDIDKFTEVGAQVLAISPQSVKSHEGFAC